MVRVRSMLLAKDANNLIAWFQQETRKFTLRHPSFGNLILLLAMPSVSWFSTCRIYLSQLTAHIADLSDRLAQSIVMGDEESCLSLRYSSIVSITNLAQIHHAWGASPSTAHLRKHRNEALKRVLQIVSEISPEELRSMDPFMSVSSGFSSFLIPLKHYAFS